MVKWVKDGMTRVKTGKLLGKKDNKNGLQKTEQKTSTWNGRKQCGVCNTKPKLCKHNWVEIR